MTSDPYRFVEDTIAALEGMPALERAIATTALIAAVQGEGDRRITRMRWAAITELHDEGMSVEQVAAQLATTSPGVIDLAVQSHRRTGAISATADQVDDRAMR